MSAEKIQRAYRELRAQHRPLTEGDLQQIFSEPNVGKFYSEEEQLRGAQPILDDLIHGRVELDPGAKPMLQRLAFGKVDGSMERLAILGDRSLLKQSALGTLGLMIAGATLNPVIGIAAAVLLAVQVGRISREMVRD